MRQVSRALSDGTGLSEPEVALYIAGAVVLASVGLFLRLIDELSQLDEFGDGSAVEPASSTNYRPVRRRAPTLLAGADR
jgi:hypothetical protein